MCNIKLIDLIKDGAVQPLIRLSAIYFLLVACVVDIWKCAYRCSTPV